MIRYPGPFGTPGLLDRQETLEIDPLHNRHDIDEPGPLHQVDIASGREGLKHALEASLLVEYRDRPVMLTWTDRPNAGYAQS